MVLLPFQLPLWLWCAFDKTSMYRKILFCRCCHCSKKFANERNLRKHLVTEHSEKSISAETGDAIYHYTSLLITTGLLRAIHNRAIQLGNGMQVILLYKYVTCTYHFICIYSLLFTKCICYSICCNWGCDVLRLSVDYIHASY